MDIVSTSPPFSTGAGHVILFARRCRAFPNERWRSA
jgi:hypothetical protein